MKLRLQKVRGQLKEPPPPPSPLLVEYSNVGGQHVGTIVHRPTRRVAFVVRGTEDYTTRTVQGIVDGLERAWQAEHMWAFYRGANDNHAEGSFELSGSRL